MKKCVLAPVLVLVLMMPTTGWADSLLTFSGFVLGSSGIDPVPTTISGTLDFAGTSTLMFGNITHMGGLSVLIGDSFPNHLLEVRTQIPELSPTAEFDLFAIIGSVFDPNFQYVIPTPLHVSGVLMEVRTDGRIWFPGEERPSPSAPYLDAFGNLDITTVPEPSSWLLFASGLAVIGFLSRRKQKGRPRPPGHERRRRFRSLLLSRSGNPFAYQS